MPLPAKGERFSTAAVRRSVRLSAADSSDSIDRLSASRDLPSIVSTTRASDISCNGTLQSTGSDPDVGTDTRRILRKSSSKGKNPSSGEGTGLVGGDPLEYILKPITEKERLRWKGWCEVESEPAFFNVMLRDFGVEGVKVQEVVSLDEELLAILPKPIYGLIFLFEFKDDDSTKQEASCPSHIWFANQTTSNACASMALLNIVMNVEEIELGETLRPLKDMTAAMSPAMRGYEVSNHDYIRQVHNSFTRKMDMLNADLALSNEATIKRSGKRRKGKNRKERQLPAAFHFIAFVPIQGIVWKLDGLERQPMNLGQYNQDWMDIARPLIGERMQRYEGNQIQFNLLSLCKSPLLTLPIDLATNIQTLRAVEDQLARLYSEWRQFIDDTESSSALRGPSPIHRLTQELLDNAPTPQCALDKIHHQHATVESLLKMRQELTVEQASLRATLIDEITTLKQDNERAISRRHDYTPMIHTWIRFLAENGTLKGLVEAETRE